MSKGVSGESQPLRPLDNPKVEVNNKLTRYARNAAIGLVAIAAIGALATFTAHGGFASIGSDAMIFGGAGAVVAGAAYGGLHFARDRRQANAAKKALKNVVSEQGLIDEMSSMKNGSTLKKQVKLNGETYEMEVLKQNDGIGKVNLKNK